MYIIQTKRLGLRNWKSTDIDPFATMNADQEVMRFFPRPLSWEESMISCQRYINNFDKYGFTYFAAETLSDRQFIGFIGLFHQTYKSHFTPCVDIGWRLKKSAWGKGYATEGAKACLEFAFARGLTEIYAVAPKLNLNSERVMQRIGMLKEGEFEHPKIAEDSPLRLCNLYVITSKIFYKD